MAYRPPPSPSEIARKAATLGGFYLAMATRRGISPEDEREALDALIRACLPHRGLVEAHLKGPDEAIIHIEVTPALASDEGVRIVEPPAIPLLATLMLCGGSLYFTNSEARGDRRLHYPLIFSNPNQPVLRIFAGAEAGERAENIVREGGQYRDLRRSNLTLVPDSPRTKSNAREAAIQEAMRRHSKAGAAVAKFLPSQSYKAMLDFALEFFGPARASMGPGLTAAAE